MSPIFKILLMFCTENLFKEIARISFI